MILGADCLVGVETVNSKPPNKSSHGQFLIPAKVTLRDTWPSGNNENLELIPLQISIKDVHQALLISILGIRTVMTLPHLNSRCKRLDTQKSSDHSWLLSSMQQFWSLALQHLQVSCLSLSELNWSSVFLGTVKCYLLILAKTPFDSAVAVKVSNLLSQVAEIFFLKMGTPQFPISTQHLLCAAYFELALLCRRSPKWSLVLLEHVVPTLRKVENRSKTMGRDLAVSVHRGSTRDCAYS